MDFRIPDMCYNHSSDQLAPFLTQSFKRLPEAFVLWHDAEFPNPLCASPFPVLSECPKGNYCPTGSALPIDCPAGTYQNDTGASECDVCPPRYYCEIGATDVLACPAGHYCPEDTEFSNQFKCPNGTYSNETALAASSECYLCPPGRCDIIIGGKLVIPFESNSPLLGVRGSRAVMLKISL